MIKPLIFCLTLCSLVSTLGATEIEQTSPSNSNSDKSAYIDQNWRCEANLALHLRPVDNQQIELTWLGKRFQLRQQMTQSGAQRYFDATSGMDLVIIPAKLMLFNRKQGTRLADNCQIHASR